MNILKRHPVGIVRRFKIVCELMFASLSLTVPLGIQDQAVAVVSVVTFVSVMAVLAGAVIVSLCCVSRFCFVGRVLFKCCIQRTLD